MQAASADPGSLSVFGALRSDLNLTAMVINKTANDLSSTLSLANFAAGPAAHVWRYSGANLAAIVAQPDVATDGGALTTVFPANSITLLVIPPATLPVPKPVVQAVNNAASYDSPSRPDRWWTIWGTGLGPAALAGLTLDSNGMVSTSVAGVRDLVRRRSRAAGVCFGHPVLRRRTLFRSRAIRPRMCRWNTRACAAIRSRLPVRATAPGLFTANASGTGQGSILNQDNTVNSAANPAARGPL